MVDLPILVDFLIDLEFFAVKTDFPFPPTSGSSFISRTVSKSIGPALGGLSYLSWSPLMAIKARVISFDLYSNSIRVVYVNSPFLKTLIMVIFASRLS